MKRFLLASLIFLVFSSVFSATCYTSESYCSERNTYDCNCRNVEYSCNKLYSYDCNCKTVSYDCNKHEEEYQCTESVLLGYYEECIEYERVPYESTCSFFGFTYSCTKHYEYCFKYYTEPVYEERETTCTQVVYDTCYEEECDSCTGYKKSTCYEEECDSCTECVEFSTRRVGYDCFDIKISNVRVVSVKPGSVKIVVDYDSNINKGVSFYFDLIKGDYGSCSKLTCGEPSNDLDCGIGGCESRASVTKQVGKGSGSVSYTINLPLLVGEGYELRVGAWLGGELVDSYDFGSIGLESFNVGLINIDVGDELIINKKGSVRLDYASNSDESVDFVLGLNSLSNNVLSEESFTKSVRQGVHGLNIPVKFNNAPGEYKIRISAWLGGELLYYLDSNRISLVQDLGGGCSSSSECASRYCQGSVCQTRGCDSFLNLARGVGCDCSNECSSGLICKRGVCVLPCSQTRGCDSCLSLSNGLGCDCNDECASGFCNGLNECSSVSSFEFNNIRLCEDEVCNNLVDDVSEGVLFLTGDFTGLSGECSLTYDLIACGEEYSGLVNDCSNPIIPVPIAGSGSCLVSVEFIDDVNKGVWEDVVAEFKIGEEEGSVINSGDSSNVYFKPSAGGFTQSVLSGEFDNVITGLITEGMSNTQVLNSLMLSFLGVTGLITYSQRGKILDYIINKRKGLSISYSDLNTRSTYIPSNVMQFLEKCEQNKDYKDSLNRMIDFTNGFIYGSGEGSSVYNNLGDITGGLVVYGDVRDVVLFFLSKIGLLDRDYDGVFVSFAVFGLIAEFTDLPDALFSSMKVAWRGLSYATRSVWVDFFKNSDEIVDFLKLCNNYIPLNKIGLFLESFAGFVNKVPVSALDECMILFSDLLKYGDDAVLKLFKLCDDLDDVINLSKLVDLSDEGVVLKIVNLPSDVIASLFKKRVPFILQGDYFEEGLSIISKYDGVMGDAFKALSDIDADYMDYFNGVELKAIHLKSLGCFNGETIELFVDDSYLSDDEFFELLVHEGAHAVLKYSDEVIVEGFKSIDDFYDNNLFDLGKEYTKDGVNILYNQLHDTSVNKIIIDNLEGKELQKWYRGWKDVYKLTIQNLEEYSKNEDILKFFSDNHREYIPKLIEMRYVFEEMGDFNKVEVINEVLVDLSKKGFEKDILKISSSYDELLRELKLK